MEVMELNRFQLNRIEEAYYLKANNTDIFSLLAPKGIE